MQASRFSLKSLRDLWSEWPATDWLLVALVVAAHFCISASTSSPGLLDHVTADRRKDIYTTTASVAALVGGFGTAAIAQYASASGRQMLRLRRWFGASLRKNWRSILSSMLLISGACLLLLIIDQGKEADSIGWTVETLLLFGLLRSLRLIWLFNLLIGLTDRDATEPTRSPAVRIPRAPAE